MIFILLFVIRPCSSNKLTFDISTQLHDVEIPIPQVPVQAFRRALSRSLMYRYFSTCQVRVVRFYQSSSPPPSPLLLSLTTAMGYTSTASAWSQRALYRTSTASARWQWALPDHNHTITNTQPQARSKATKPTTMATCSSPTHHGMKATD